MINGVCDVLCESVSLRSLKEKKRLELSTPNLVHASSDKKPRSKGHRSGSRSYEMR